MPKDLPYAFARFVPASEPLEVEREDTRLYFHRAETRDEKYGTCVGSFWLQNPGSARYESETTQDGEFGSLKTDPLMKHIRAVLDVVMLHASPPTDAYVELLNVHYFSDTKSDLKGEGILAHIQPEELCKQGISPSSRFLVLGLGKGWAAQHDTQVAAALMARGGNISIIAADGHQSSAANLEVKRIEWSSSQGTPSLPLSTFPNPIGASREWKQAYVEQVASAIVESLE